MPAPRSSTRLTGSPTRPLPLLAAWAGLAGALVSSVIAIGVVAVLWLPASGGSGSAGSAIRAGVITFLAGVHGGVTVDGVPTAFVPLGLTVLVVLVIRRATGAVLAAADERSDGGADLRSLGLALLAQSCAFSVACGLLAAISDLGTSGASVPGALLAGLLLGALAAGSVLLRHPAVTDVRDGLLPVWLGTAWRCAVAALAVQVAAGALLVGGSLIVHREQAVEISRQVGGGWSGVPVLVLGVLAAPNAALAGAAYLSGAGFAVGAGTTVSLTGSTTGLVPAFPLLAALPSGPGGTAPGWLLAVVSPIAAGTVVAVLAGRAASSTDRWRTLGAGLVGTAVLGALLAWQGGGGVGSGRLHVVGASPWQFGLVAALWTGIAAAVLLGLRAGVERLRSSERPDRPSLRETLSALTSVEDYGDVSDDSDGDRSERDRDEAGRRPRRAG